MSMPTIFAPYLGQTTPGNWFLYVADLEPVALPSWLVEQQTGSVAKDDLARVLGQIFVHGRRLGKAEGAASMQAKIKEALGL